MHLVTSRIRVLMRSTWLPYLWRLCRNLVSNLFVHLDLSHPPVLPNDAVSTLNWLTIVAHDTIGRGLHRAWIFNLTLSIYLLTLGKKMSSNSTLGKCRHIYCLVLRNLYKPLMLTPSNTFDYEFHLWNEFIARRSCGRPSDTSVRPFPSRPGRWRSLA
jgi:hypothetical protein